MMNVYLMQTKWLACPEQNVNDAGDDDDDDDDGINPEDSVSNVTSKHSSKRTARSGESSPTSSARFKAQSDRAALLAQVAALKERHVLEEQEQQLKRRREQPELEAMLAASTAKLAGLQASEVNSVSKPSSNPMNFYLDKEKSKAAALTALLFSLSR